MHFCELIAHEKDLAYGEIRTTVWQDETLQSKRSSTGLAGPGFIFSYYSQNGFKKNNDVGKTERFQNADWL